MLVGIIDDNATNLKVYVNVVSRIPGVTTKTFQSSAEGLTWCKETEPDLLVLDYNMPPPNGVEFIKAYRALRPAAQTPIIMITGEQDREIRHQALDVGANDFLSKPADPVEFLARVRNLLSAAGDRKMLGERTNMVAEAVRKSLHDATAHEIEMIRILMRAVEYRDNKSGMHVIRMGAYASLLGGALGLSSDEQGVLMRATPMHDVGKVGVRDAVLLKMGPLTQPERDHMRQHAALGHEILRAGKSAVLQLAAIIAHTHHEHWDGAGYPAGLAKDTIPLPGRIAAVADALDAMLENRPYRKALEFDAAMKELENQSGSQFDPAIVTAAMVHRAQLRAIAETYADPVTP